MLYLECSDSNFKNQMQSTTRKSPHMLDRIERIEISETFTKKTMYITYGYAITASFNYQTSCIYMMIKSDYFTSLDQGIVTFDTKIDASTTNEINEVTVNQINGIKDNSNQNQFYTSLISVIKSKYKQSIQKIKGSIHQITDHLEKYSIISRKCGKSVLSSLISSQQIYGVYIGNGNIAVQGVYNNFMGKYSDLSIQSLEEFLMQELPGAQLKESPSEGSESLHTTLGIVDEREIQIEKVIYSEFDQRMAEYNERYRGQRYSALTNSSEHIANQLTIGEYNNRLFRLMI